MRPLDGTPQQAERERVISNLVARGMPGALIRAGEIALLIRRRRRLTADVALATAACTVPFEKISRGVFWLEREWLCRTRHQTATPLCPPSDGNIKAALYTTNHSWNHRALPALG